MSPAADDRTRVADAVAAVLLEHLPSELAGIKWLVRHPDDGEIVIELASSARFRVAVAQSS
jgi:hypothetical protein